MNTTTANATILPSAVRRFLEAVNFFDALAAADSFTVDASVLDEDRDYVGRNAIRAWVAETSGKYRPAYTLIHATVNGDDTRLSVAVSGQFPGSPVTLDFVFRLRHDKISTLTIE